MTRYWFKRRRYGFGWTPVTREGWLALGLYLAAVLGGALVLGKLKASNPPQWTTTAYLSIVLVLTIGFIAIAVIKGPTPRWRWGRQAEDDPEEDF